MHGKALLSHIFSQKVGKTACQMRYQELSSKIGGNGKEFDEDK